ncbi:MAG: cysteine--tRNA ligase [Bordetella sp.]|nr:MAG: cysteine--tRNA ligase [Bordetella sp.]
MQNIYNTLTRIKEKLKPVCSGHVKMYVCGVTVYDYCHLGHARIFVNFDIVQRWLCAQGLNVKYVRNITDIDDKIIFRSQEKKIQLGEITNFYIAAMHADEQALGVKIPYKEPLATSYIKEMLDIIDKLKAKDIAYQNENGDMNFSIRKFSNYGKLSGKILKDLKIGNRVKLVSIDKRDSFDFVLWKRIKNNSIAPEIKWDSQYGSGRPGWHLECSAMSNALLGLPLDIHGGGPDLLFPHHENEIAQSESAFECSLSNLWMHCGPLMINGQKMSKSLGNFRTIRQIIGIGNTSEINYQVNMREAEMLRFFIIRKHYRSILHYSFENLIDAQNALDKLYQTLKNVDPEICNIDWCDSQAENFRISMNDDFNTPNAISILFELANQANKKNCHKSSGLLKALAGLLGILQQNPSDYFKIPSRYNQNYKTQKKNISKKYIEELIVQRLNARKLKNYNEADRIRKLLQKYGVDLQDKKDGNTEWQFIN